MSSPQLFPERTTRFDVDLFGEDQHSASDGSVDRPREDDPVDPPTQFEAKTPTSAILRLTEDVRREAPPSASQTGWWERRISAIEERQKKIEESIAQAIKPGNDLKSTRFWINLVMQVAGAWMIYKGREEIGATLMLASGVSYTKIMTDGKQKVASTILGAITNAISGASEPASEKTQQPKRPQ